MPFDSSTIHSVEIRTAGADLFVSWRDASPAADRWYQVYLNGALSWHGRELRCCLPAPAGAGEVAWAEVGAVDASEVDVSFASELTSPALFGDCELRWEANGDASGGGDVVGFIVSRSRDPALVDTPECDVAFVPSGQASGTPPAHRWRSRPLSAGEWHFSVKPVDRFGNVRRPGSIVSVQVGGVPPRPAPAGSSWPAVVAIPDQPLRFLLSWPGPPAP